MTFARDSFLARFWRLLCATVEGYIADDAFSRGASIAYFTLFSLAPVLLVVIAVAVMAFGREAAQGAVVGQLSDLMGRDTAEAIEAMIRSAGESLSGTLATLIGLAVILIAVSGVFSEVQLALNAIWKVTPSGSAAAATAIGACVKSWLPTVGFALQAVDVLVSGALIAAVFATIYRVLPDRDLRWRDVLPGALFAALLFQLGKYLIAFYIGETGIASSFGAAGALIVMLLWIFYSAQIFLLGAEFSRAWTMRTRGMPTETSVRAASSGN